MLHAFGRVVVAASVALIATATEGTFVFSQVHVIEFAKTQFPTMVAGADLDGDGMPDLVVPGRNLDGFVHVYRNVGGGVVEPAQVLEFGGQTDSAAIGDLDGDGILDLAVAIRSGPRGVGIRLGVGDGTFTTDGPFLGGSRELRGVELVDLNNNGSLDVVAVDYLAARVRIHRNLGDATFAPEESIRLVAHAGSFVYPQSITSADLDGDGWPDLIVTATGAGRIIQIRNRGDGTFEPAINRRPPPFDGIQPGLVNTAVADMNGDGSLDLVSPWIMGYLSQRVGVLPNDGEGNFDEVVSATTLFGAVTFYGAVADFDGDGKPDVAIGHALPGVLGLTRNLGNLAFGPTQIIPFATFVRHVLPIDMDGDGRPDLVVTDAPVDRIHILLNQTPPAEGGVADESTTPSTPTRVAGHERFAGAIDPALRDSTDGADLALWLLEQP